MGSGFILFMVMGLFICIEKAYRGDSSMGCLIPIILVGIAAACFFWVISLITIL